MEQDLELIGSVEFGDWLINECELETMRAESGDLAARDAATLRLASLEQAKMLLLEFLTLQDEMMQLASRERSSGGSDAVQRRNSLAA